MLAIYMAFLVVALLLLGELFSFHLVLISRQMSTYDFIVAQREQQQKGGPAISTASSLADLMKKAITCQVGGSVLVVSVVIGADGCFFGDLHVR
jgi:hypothetical protein